MSVLPSDVGEKKKNEKDVKTKDIIPIKKREAKKHLHEESFFFFQFTP